MVSEIWHSLRALPLWVQIWVFAILGPVNMISLVFWTEPDGALIAVLAVGAMALNGVIMLYERGFSRAMALPHVAIWTPMMFFVIANLTDEATGVFRTYLWVLLVVDIVSLGFDFKDARDWLQGARAVAGRGT